MKRIIVLAVLALEGIQAIYGGSRLIIAPDGHILKMSVEIMHGAFPSFLIPGLVLTGLGLLSLFAFTSVLRKSSNDWIWAGLALVGFAIWFITEVIILRELHILHVVWGIPVFIATWAALPLIPEEKFRKIILKIRIIK